ncbi:MAG: peptidase C45 acyl-coenzyme A:6-aminopenicillanic acid acyl-transferase [Planctomycetaceae bacterium]|nr:peptidase C45 acyl-coenzyme A:6-aminopenicillanic acid acyl-transferase [Planctomycetaceae bacterium]
MKRCVRLLLLLVMSCIPAVAAAAEPTVADLVAAARPYLEAIAGKQSRFGIQAEIHVPIDGRSQLIRAGLTRYDDESFDLELAHQDYAITIRRRPDQTQLELPLHQTALIGKGAVAASDRLSPRDITTRLLSPDSEVDTVRIALNALASGDVETVAGALLMGSRPQYDTATGRWILNDTVHVRIPALDQIHVETGDVSVQLKFVGTDQISDAVSVSPPAGFQVTELSRDELERTFSRGLRRATEILKPSDRLRHPEQTARSVSHGTLQWIEGQRVATLWGTPEEIGTAHGELLADESRRCIESVLYTFGTAHVIRTGHWFRHDLDAAYQRLSPHIPERHKQETRALAASLHLDAKTVEALNVFPELFHCSGFAVFGTATTDGTLYHGRVLDYMTTIGLQDAATTFIVRPRDHLAFVNVGYGGFIGSVSGMNAAAISLGEMGGRGEGNWDGAPMATLMRRALEECQTLAEVRTLWTTTPRTCEYYYVFADGKTNQTVGVAATPEHIEFIGPGEAHERLGTGITDAVVLSAGGRLEELRRRVTEKHGKIDAEIAMWLMSRPVAMQSNLHNVLFVPAQQILYVANAGHGKPAAEMPYVRLDLQQLLNQIPADASP